MYLTFSVLLLIIFPHVSCGDNTSQGGQSNLHTKDRVLPDTDWDAA